VITDIQVTVSITWDLDGCGRLTNVTRVTNDRFDNLFQLSNWKRKIHLLR